ncbi:MAG: hypothetical protein ACXADC_09070 [Candidatus Thorarchaeota archaeon]|jgi:hypothetical protein
MKTRHIQLIAGLAMFVLCISTCATTTNAVVIWEDDFDDGTYAPEWTVCDNLTSAGFLNGDFGWNGSTWSATNNYLEKVGWDEWGVISHPSNIAYGTWSFDVNASGTIFFISNNFYDFDDLYEDLNSYFIFFEFDTYEEQFTINLAKRIDDARTILASHSDVPVADWYHLDVTRTTTGYFSVYLDHSQDPIMEVEDTDIDTSEMFWLWCYEGYMIDNIVVDNEVPTTTTPPPPPIDPVLLVLIVGTGVGVVLIAVVILRRR